MPPIRPTRPVSSYWSPNHRASKLSAEPPGVRSRTRLWTLRRDRHEATLDLRTVPAIGPELLLSIDGDVRRSRLYRLGEGRTLARSIIAVREMFAAKGWTA